MFKSNFFKVFVAVFMAVVMSHVPQSVGAAEMISTAEVVEQISRKQAEQKILVQVQREDVQKELKKLGISTKEVELRMASLSDSEIQSLASQLDQAQYGGWVIAVLLVVVLVLLIIYLAKRI